VHKIAVVSLALIFAIGCVGCGGMRLQDAQVNHTLPNDWAGRSLMNNTSDFRFHLVENVGLVVTPSPGGKYDVVYQPILPDAFTPREEAIKEGSVYHSILTQGASTRGGYLSFTASLSSEDAIDYSIVDISRADVPWKDFPEAKIRAAAALPNPTHQKRLWIQSLILSRIVSNQSTATKCDGEAAAPVFKVGATCHVEASDTANDFGIAAVFLDIDKWVGDNPANTTGPVVTTKTVTTMEERRITLASSAGETVVARVPVTTVIEKVSVPSYISVQDFVGTLSDYRGAPKRE